MRKSDKKYDIKPMQPDEALELIEIANKASAEFIGVFDELEKAIGMLFMGRLYGWKVLVLIHNKRTLKKYEEILDIKVRDYFEEEGPLTTKVAAYEFVKKAGNYWKAVSGDVKVDNRRNLENN